MLSIDSLDIWWIVLLTISHTAGLSFNQPKFCPSATWNPDAITLANASIVGNEPVGIFVNNKNTVYVAGTHLQSVLVWLEGSTTPIRNISGNLFFPFGIFVTNNGDIYADNGYINGRVDQWTPNATSPITAMYVKHVCFSLFVDINDNLYCCLGDLHQVVKKLSNDDANSSKIIAGIGINGSAPYMLSFPRGIFVDTKLNLYVADLVNNRIQFFTPGNSNATTLAGDGAPATIALNWPTDIVLDGDGYMFIVEFFNYRIVKSGPTGFRCIVGCGGVAGLAANQLNFPWSLNFDTLGNLFVTDTGNSRIQKFLLATNSCGPSYNQPKFCPDATWNPNATTFANKTVVSTLPLGIFIDINNTVYVAARNLNRISIWMKENVTTIKTILALLQSPSAVYATINGDIFIDNGNSNNRIDKWSLNATNSTIAMYVNGPCQGVFVDMYDNLYCSQTKYHRVTKRLFSDASNITSIVAGTAFAGSSSYMLNAPQGIFVDAYLNLYVADCNNNRIQAFKPDQLNGTTLVGNGSSGTIVLNCPNDVVLDGDGYLYITDRNNHRVVATGPNGLRCIVGCTRVPGNASHQLNTPFGISFDTYGNIFVTDAGNGRVQKFLSMDNFCEETTTDQTSTLSQELSTIPATNLILNQSCFAPIIILIPGTSSIGNPLQFRRNQDFYISSNIQLNCNGSLSTTTQWTISNCTSSCSSLIQIDQTILTTFSELYIPARTLSYGIYELRLTVTMKISPSLTSSISAFVKITPSGITANLVQFGTSMITRGHEQDLTLDPGTFSIDYDQNTLNASDWKYSYYCRIYGVYNFPNILGLLLSISDPRIDPYNPSCISNQSRNGTSVQYGGINGSSITILSGSLSSNRTYQFMVYMENRRNITQQATGYLLVQVDDTHPQMVVIACVISTMCIPNLEFQLVNPTTQVALFSVCLERCSSLINITWNIYQGLNTSLSTVQWTLFNPYQNNWFFGTNTSNFTAINQLFLNNPHVTYWRFEVVYSFLTETSSSALNFVINQPPRNGSCSINPLNGTTSTLFTISCSDWFDEDQIKDYLIYGYTADSSDIVMLAFSSVSNFNVYLPAGNENTSLLQIIIHIRDTLDCITEYNMTSVIVTSNLIDITNLINSLQDPTSSLTNNPIIQLLSSGNQNIVGQILTSFSQQFNKMNIESVQDAVSNGIPATSISISPLGSRNFSPLNQLNISALIEYNKQLNSYANVRDYLMIFATNLPITTSSCIKLQALSLAQLTQATNQLTRTSSMMACEKCYQLAQALYSMSTKIPYEDVQNAAIQISQCASNVLSAVNGPLQQRTNVLNSDSSGANSFPADYDTDLESDWSNPNLFSDGTDFSWETIQKNRNLYYQKQIADKILSQTTEITSLLTSALNIHLNIGQNSTINTSSVFMSLETISIKSLSNKFLQQIGNACIHLPSNFQLNSTDTSAISLRSMMNPLAPAGNFQITNLSTSLSFSILDHNGNDVSIQSIIELIIPRDPNLVIPSMNLQNVTSLNSTIHHQLFNLHYINITSNLPISIHFEMHPLNRNLAYLVIYKFDSSPQLNSSFNNTDGWTLFCPSNLTNESIYTYFIDNQRTIGHQSVIFGIRELNSTDSCLNQSIFNLVEPFNFSSNYELRIYTSGCYYLDSNNNWKSDGLVVGSLTNHYQTQCFSNHLTTFAGGYIVLPSPINWNYVFSNADFAKNKTIYITIILVCIIYILLIIYARYKDKKDLEKLGVTPLSDNYKTDQYFYEIIVFTGHRKNAGTESKVYFILAGDDDETHVRKFSDSKRKIFQRGGINAFIMSVPKSLGLLNYIRIWHDNTGNGRSASWFLKYIIIRDLQTMEKSYFICQNWLAVEKGDGLIERVLPTAGEIEKRDFSYILSKQAYHSISEGHLWFSIFSRPPSNKFTRVQRCTCCFVLLFTAMLLNILYYDQKNDLKTTTNSLSFGPLYFTSEQISIGIIVDILSFLPSILLVQLFRRIQPRNSHQKMSLVRQENKNKRSGLIFPWWCVCIAYGLSLILAVVSIFFIIIRGIEFGDLKTQKWLTTLLAGFFSSILLIQPIKVISLAIFFAFFFRNPDKDEEAAEYDNFQLDHNEVYLHLPENDSPFNSRSQMPVNRLNQSEIAWARNQRLKEIQMWSIIQEIFTYFIYLSLLYFVSYSNLNQNSFYQVDHLRKFFGNTRQTDYDYTKISTINQYWLWLDNSFIENIRAQQWYNGESPRNLSGFINDKSNRLIGWATMRQLRIKSNSCFKNSTCQYDYNLFNEEKQSYQPGWNNQTTQNYSSSIQQAFQYKTGDQLDTYMYIGQHATYSSGGYVYEFRGRLDDLQSNISLLHQLEWIDGQTRAVIIQITLYNPNSQLFTSVNLLAEFLSTGGIDVQARFDPISFQVFQSIPQLICAIFYMIFIIYMMIIEIQSLLKLKLNYFRNFWSYINLGIIICSWISVGIYIWRYEESNRIGKLFQKTNGFVYINLQLAVYIDDIYKCLLGFCCFFGTIKFVRLCRFNHRLIIFIKTLQYASKELLSFACMFSIVYMAFLILFYLLFVSYLSGCSSLLDTAQMLFEMTLMQFDANGLMDAGPFLGPFCFSLFILLVVFVCMSMFFTIINENFRTVRDNAKLNGNRDQSIYLFMFYKFQCWLGIEKSIKLKQMEEQDEQMRSKYFHPVENFPEKIDQLLEALNRLYMDQRIPISRK